MNIGLYFGAFNPVHDGHVSVANYVLNNCKLDKVWLILTPQSPHKRNNILIDFKHRYSMLQIAFEKHKNILPKDVEKNLQSPNYSIDTLEYLKAKNAKNIFSVIIGNDNMDKFTTWKEYNRIIENHKIYVYPRKSLLGESKMVHQNIHYLNGPHIDVSATGIRKSIAANQVSNLKIHPKVFKYLTSNNIEINI
jgi:nicotinate-nucleotide adenylyltransferase|tara:strand:- start:1016 stop:1594 length:579 start_codon:yes stop_codon:yes gene_type:complete